METNGTVTVTEELPTAIPIEQETVEKPPETNGTHDKPRPVFSLRYNSDSSTSIQVALWPNTITLRDGSVVTVLSLTIQRRYKDGNGDWHTSNSFRNHDLPVLMHALQRAHSYALDQREQDNGTPF